VNRKARRAQQRKAPGANALLDAEIRQLAPLAGLTVAGTAVAVRVVALRLDVGETELARSFYDRLKAGATLQDAAIDEAIARNDLLTGKTRDEVHAWLFEPYLPSST